MNGPRHAESGPVSRGRDPARWSPDRRDRECLPEELEGAPVRPGDRLRPPAGTPGGPIAAGLSLTGSSRRDSHFEISQRLLK